MDRSETYLPDTTWHPQLDNPTLLGWSVVAAYLLAAASCTWMALKASKWAPEGNRIWWLLAVVLLLLGINKQLNLQTLLIVLGRRAALAGGWYGHRRLAQALFCGAFGLLGFGFLGWFASRARQFIHMNRLAFAGMIVLLAFVELRASSINHADDLLGFDLKDEYWGWIMELSGCLLIILSATAKSAALRRGGTV